MHGHDGPIYRVGVGLKRSCDFRTSDRVNKVNPIFNSVSFIAFNPICYNETSSMKIRPLEKFCFGVVVIELVKY